MSASSVARQYAQALYDVARRNDAVNEVGRDLSDLADLVSSHTKLRAVFDTPLIAPAKKRALVAGIVDKAEGLTNEVRRLLPLLAERDRLMLIRQIAAAYAARCSEADRTVDAEVRTAAPLEATQKAALEHALSTATGQTVTVRHEVDPSLIGGLVAQVGSLVFDGSVARQVERMRQRLLADV